MVAVLAEKNNLLFLLSETNLVQKKKKNMLFAGLGRSVW